MARIDNPAGRLHELLTRYDTAASQSIAQAWASVLEVPVDELMYHISGVIRLMRDTRTAYEELEDADWSPILDHLKTLSASILPLGIPWDQPKTEARPNTDSMSFLRAFSSHLHQVASEGELPGSEDLESLRAAVRELIQNLSEADLEPHIKRILLSRVSDVLEALDHLGVYGADGARKALESLGLAAAWYDEAAQDKSAMDRVKSVVKTGVALFSISGVAVGGFLTLDSGEQRIDHILNPPQIHQRQLPPPPPLIEGPNRPELPPPDENV